MASVYLGLAQLYHFKHQDTWEATAIVTVAAISLGGSGSSILQQSFQSKWHKKKAAIGEQLDGLLLSAADLCSSQMPGNMIDNVKDFNVAMFLLRGRRWRWADRRHLSSEVRRGFGFHQPSNVRWTYGKGVVGACWASMRPVFKDLSKINQRHGSSTEAQWYSARDTTRMGMTFKDWQATSNKYGTIVAVPVHDAKERFVGVLALDVASGSDLSSQETRLIQALQGVARLLALIVS